MAISIVTYSSYIYIYIYIYISIPCEGKYVRYTSIYATLRMPKGYIYIYIYIIVIVIVWYGTCRGKGYTFTERKVLPVFLLLAQIGSLRHWT